MMKRRFTQPTALPAATRLAAAPLAAIPALLAFMVALPSAATAQTLLQADGPGDTYELISRALAPGADAIESPDCSHLSFGRHITEVMDEELGRFVFEFHAHAKEDNDRCYRFDRQRMEIKTYEPSPDSLKGTPGEMVMYSWKFRLPEGFQPTDRFTHIYQIKAVGGNDGLPIFTLTPRRADNPSDPPLVHLIHDNTVTLASLPMSELEGTWVEAVSLMRIGARGTYSMVIRRVADGKVLLQYRSDDIMTIRPDNTFIRPKWGVYRSLNQPELLRDETMRFNDFLIAEMP
jgi:hypothetical protein